MKVLFVCSGNGQFGISPFIQKQGDSLIKAGVNLEYFYIQGKGFIGYFRMIFRLRKSLKKDLVDLLHAHYGLCGWVAYLAKQKKIPLVLSYMGSDILPVINGKIAKSAPIARFSRALQNHADHVIVKSDNLRGVLNKVKGVSIIPNGVDLFYFKPLKKEECRKKLGLDAAKRIILFLGDPDDQQKNIQLVKHAVSLLSDENALLVCPYPAKSELIPLYINIADVLVVPSISEGSPNVVKEAMACNCPIVATDVGDIKWVIGDTEGCFLTSFNPQDLAEKIKKVLAFDKRTSGRERIIKLGLDSESIALKIVAIYKEIIKNRSDRI